MAEVRKTQTPSTPSKSLPPAESSALKASQRAVEPKAATRKSDKVEKIPEKAKAEPVKTAPVSKQADPQATKTTKVTKATETPKATESPKATEAKRATQVSPKAETSSKVETRPAPSKTTGKIAEPVAVASEKAAPAKSTRKKTEKVITQDAIAGRAFELWQARGGVHGSDLEDWYQAEQDLMAGH